MKLLYKPYCKYDENLTYPSNFHIVLKVNGFWPTHGDANCSAFRLLDILYTSWSWFVICSMFLIALAELAYSLSNITDVASTVQSLSAAMVSVMVFFRISHMRYAMRQMKELLRMFANNIWIKKSSHPVIFTRCIRNMWPTFGVGIALWTTLFIYIILPIFLFLTTEQSLQSRDKRFPYLMRLPYDDQKPINYIITYIGCIYCGYVAISQYYAMDVMFSLFVSFACGQFQILHGQISRLIPECHLEWLHHYGSDERDSFKNRINLQRIYAKRLHQIACRHEALIRFCMALEKFYTFPLMVNLANSTFLIGLGVFQFVFDGGNSLLDFLRFFFYLLSVAGQLYILCNLGSMLITESKSTAEMLFMCNWEGGQISKNSPLRQRDDVELNELNRKFPTWRFVSYHPTDNAFRQKLRFMILRSQRPVQLTTMKFAILSLETLNTILSSSLSYFALLKSFLDKQH